MKIPDDPFEPRQLRKALTECGVFLAAWEMLKQSVVDKLRNFYSTTWKDHKFVPDPDYYDEVKGQHKHLLDGSLAWLVKSGVLTQKDVEVVHAIRGHRNDIAHDLPTYAWSWGKQVDHSLLVKACRLVHKVDNFWARADFEGDPDVPAETDFSTATSLKALLLDHMVTVSLTARLEGDDSAEEKGGDAE